MKIISFAMTTAALLAGRKSVTRREWTDAHAARFKPGELVQAWSKSPHRKGRKVAVIRILSVTKQPTHLIPDGDWEAEGFAYMSENGILLGPNLDCSKLWRLWRQDRAKEAYTIRFELVAVEPDACPEMFHPQEATA